jgi:hypothetical protein
MARSHAFWVILSGAVPTAFRSPRREDLLPTLHQLQRTQPDVALRWFDRGQLWDSPEAAKTALVERRRQKSGRNSDWRPGGAHKDPRARYQISRDQKRARFKQRQRRDFDSKPEPTPGAPGASGPSESRPPFDRDRPDNRWRKPQGPRPFRPQGDRQDRQGGPKPPGSNRPFGDRRPNRPPSDRPFGDRPYKPKGDGRPPSKFGRPPGKFGKPPSKFGRPPGKFGRPPGKFGRPAGKFGPPRGRGPKPKK